MDVINELKDKKDDALKKEKESLLILKQEFSDYKIKSNKEYQSLNNIIDEKNRNIEMIKNKNRNYNNNLNEELIKSKQ